MTKSASLTQAEISMQIAIYADELGKWPADAVRAVLQGWRSEWWPSFEELERGVKERAQERSMLLSALTRL